LARTGLTHRLHLFHADCAAGFVEAPGYKRLVAELTLDKVMLQDVLAKTL
jgi:hypothetical protein